MGVASLVSVVILGVGSFRVSGNIVGVGSLGSVVILWG